MFFFLLHKPKILKVRSANEPAHYFPYYSADVLTWSKRTETLLKMSIEEILEQPPTLAAHFTAHFAALVPSSFQLQPRARHFECLLIKTGCSLIENAREYELA